MSDVELSEGEEALYCLDCEEWLPCQCDAIPTNAEFRIYPGEDDA